MPQTIEATVLAADQLYRLGGSIELDGRVTWFPATSRGYAPANSYLLTAGSAALLIDPGLPSIQPPLFRQLGELLRPNTRLSLLPTRPAEFDSIGNTASIIAEFPVRHVYGIIELHLIIGFQARFELPPADADTSWKLDDSVTWDVCQPGDTIELTPGRPLELVRTPLRVLPTMWVYDAATRTLFTSDCFNHVLRKSPDDSCILVTGDRDTTTVADVEDLLRHGKFDFLARGKTNDIAQGIASVFAEREIETIAPGYGCVLSGKAVVERHIQLLLDAIAAIGVRSATTSMEGPRSGSDAGGTL